MVRVKGTEWLYLRDKVDRKKTQEAPYLTYVTYGIFLLSPLLLLTHNVYGKEVSRVVREYGGEIVMA